MRRVTRPVARWVMGIGCGLAVFICPSICAEDGLTHSQQVDLARRVISAEPYVGELGVQDDPFQFAKMSDAQLNQYSQRVERGLRSALAKHYSAEQALTKYESQLISQGKATKAAIRNYYDPSGKLQNLQKLVERSGKVYRDYLCARIDLMEEANLRKNPQDFLQADREIHSYMRDAAAKADYWEKLLKALEQGDPEAKRLVDQYKQQDRGGRSAYQKTVKTGLNDKIATVGGKQRQTRLNPESELGSVARSSDEFDITYGDIYGPGANPQLIPIIEAEQIRRLPAELKEGVPRDIQRIFMYGGYERLSREGKRHVRRSIDQFKKSIPDQRLLTSEWHEVMARAETSVSPQALSADWRQKATAGAEAAAMLMVYLVQGITDYSYGVFRERKWEEAYRKVAGEIPKGKQEKVLFIEEVRHCRLEFYSWVEVDDVNAFRGEIELETKDEVFEKLKNLRGGYNPNPSPHHHRRLYSATVTGTGENLDKQPSVHEAKKAGMDMGRLARGGKLTNELMRNTYSRYNKWEDTREAFKEGYRKTSSGNVE